MQESFGHTVCILHTENKLLFFFDNLKSYVFKKGSKYNEESAVEIMKLWLTLNELNDEFITVHSVIFLIVFVCGVLSMVINTYSFLLLMIHQSNGLISVAYLITTCICGIVILVFCESGNALIEIVSYNDGFEILNISLQTIIRIF